MNSHYLPLTPSSNVFIIVAKGDVEEMKERVLRTSPHSWDRRKYWKSRGKQVDPYTLHYSQFKEGWVCGSNNLLVSLYTYPRIAKKELEACQKV